MKKLITKIITIYLFLITTFLNASSFGYIHSIKGNVVVETNDEKNLSLVAIKGRKNIHKLSLRIWLISLINKL